MAHEATEQELDEDGIVVQRYLSRVLVVLPQEGIGDQILRYARSSLYNVHVGSVCVAPDYEAPIKGRLQDEFLADEPLERQDMSAYSGILVGGGAGDSTLAGVPQVLELVRAAYRDGKLVGTWGNGLDVLVRAGVVKGHRVTGASQLAAAVKQAGGKFTAREVTVSRNLVTARDEGAGMRFGQALAEFVRI